MDPDHLTAVTGAGSVLDLLLHCVADPDDVVLVPAPYYPAFDNDLQVRVNAHPLLGPYQVPSCASAAAAVVEWSAQHCCFHTAKVLQCICI